MKWNDLADLVFWLLVGATEGEAHLGGELNCQSVGVALDRFWSFERVRLWSQKIETDLGMWNKKTRVLSYIWFCTLQNFRVVSQKRVALGSLGAKFHRLGSQVLSDSSVGYCPAKQPMPKKMRICFPSCWNGSAVAFEKLRFHACFRCVCSFLVLCFEPPLPDIEKFQTLSFSRAGACDDRSSKLIKSLALLKKIRKLILCFQ